MPPPRGLVQRFDHLLHRRDLLPRGARLLVACSGGADSVALLRFRYALLILLLLFHLLTRLAAANAIPLEHRGMSLYTITYRVCLSHLAGHGYEQFAIDNTSAAAPVRDFLDHRRPALQPAELAAAFASGLRPIPNDSLERGLDAQGRPADITPGILTLGNVRTLEVRIVTLLWKLFGIRWDVIYAAAILASTATCLLVFLLARQIGGYSVGLLAALFYTAAPIEQEFVLRALRDINPLWFATLGFWATFCLAGRFRSLPANLLSCLAAGTLATLGLGFRPDLLPLPLFLLFFLILHLVAQRRGRLPTAAFALAFLIGVGLTYQTLRALAPAPQVTHRAIFHNAYFGGAVRANLAGIEDTFANFRCDGATAEQSARNARAAGDDPSAEPLYSLPYDARCRRMYVSSLSANAYPFLAKFPKFCFRALSGPAFAALPVNFDENGSVFRRPTSWHPAMRWTRSLLLDPLTRAAPVLTLLGMLAVLLLLAPSVPAAALACYVPFYAAILFVVLPEYRHTGQLVLPMSILAALGLVSLLRLFGRPRWAALRGITRSRWRFALGLSLGVFVLWIAGLAVAYPWCVARRAALLADIRGTMQNAPLDPSPLLSPQVFSVRQPAAAAPVSYLLEIAPGSRPASLLCRHLRPGDGARCYESQHSFTAAPHQYFFVTLAPLNSRPHVCTVLLSGDARILSVRRAVLPAWPPYALSTLFDDGPVPPGSPRTRDFSNLTWYDPVLFDSQALTPTDRATYHLPAITIPPLTPSTPVP